MRKRPWLSSLKNDSVVGGSGEVMMDDESWFVKVGFTKMKSEKKSIDLIPMLDLST